jgi:hypothetical protein
MTKRCKGCREVFTADRPMQVVCSYLCAIDISKKMAAKAVRADKKETKLKLDALQTKPQLVKKAQTAFNAYIRARDVGKTCISCDKPLDGGANTFDAGHYRSVGSAPHMRFVEDNVHGQCKHCNNWLAGNHVEYRKRLVERIGEKQLDLLESDSVLRKYTREGLIEIARQYNAMARQLTKDRLD